ncbi:MAG: hypothetical protein K2X47_16750 [Bdellovibrionales bacterium]|nr:hypothetical protein [Bdellovibrionales bacterium]
MVESCAHRGFETLTFKKVVTEYLFFVYLYFEPPTGKVGEGKLFGVGARIDLLDGFSERHPRMQKGEDLVPICCPFNFLSFFELDKFDLELADRQRAHPFSVREKWMVGANINEAKAICSDALNIPFLWIQKYEELFRFPAPLDRITIQSLYDLRDLGIYTDLLQAIGAHHPEKLAQVLLCFYTSREDRVMISALQEFLQGKKRIVN